MKLDAMRNVDIRTVDPDSLVDIRDVVINIDLPQIERLKDYIRQVNNPFCYRYKGAVIKHSYADTGATIEDRLEDYLYSL